MRAIRIALSLVLVALGAGCAGPNPNPGERTSDMALLAGNFDRAVEVLEPRAEAGEPWAQLRPGTFYENGCGVERDLQKAEYWYKQAAAQKAEGNWKAP